MIGDFPNDASPVHDLAKALRAMTVSATNSDADAYEFRRILRFIGQVVQVVGQSFEQTYAILIDIANLTQEDVDRGRHRELRRELDLIMAKSHFREATEICSKLRHLSSLYTDTIEPIIELRSIDSDAWANIFEMINEYEGDIIWRVEGAVSELGEMLDNASTRDIDRARSSARARANSLREDLIQLRDLNTQILGLSGRTGLMELTSTGREEAAQIMIAESVDQRYMDQRRGTFMGDTFSNISGSTIVNHSKVKDAFNVAKEQIDEETAQVILRIAEAVAKSENKEAGEALDMFNEELTKAEPRKSILKIAWEGLVSALPDVPKIAGASAAIAKLLI